MPRTTTLPKTEVIQRYEQGETTQQLATAFSRSEATMRENLHRWGAAIRRTGPKRQFECDETYFDTINTEEKAYWLGFIFADGCVFRTKRGQYYLRVELQKLDRGHLAKLAKALKAEQTIKDSPTKNASRLVISSARLCKALIALGCIPRKTCNHGTPKLPAWLMPHFYRGYFDGDGHLSYVPCNHNWYFAVIGAPGFIPQMQRWLMRHAKVGPTKLRKHGRAVVFHYNGGKQVERIMKLLYKDANVILDRKRRMYGHLLARNTKLGRSSKERWML